VILRKWLADGLLTKLAHLANVDATLPALDNQDVISEIQNKGDIVYFLTGGVMMNCSPVSGVYYSKLDAPEAPRIPIHTMDSVKMPVKAFLNQRRVYFDGSYSRQRKFCGIPQTNLAAHI
jgi:hypothetical protein